MLSLDEVALVMARVAIVLLLKGRPLASLCFSVAGVFYSILGRRQRALTDEE
jgi:hypothetical protein